MKVSILVWRMIINHRDVFHNNIYLTYNFLYPLSYIVDVVFYQRGGHSKWFLRKEKKQNKTTGC